MRLVPALLALVVMASACADEPDAGPRQQAADTVLLEGEAATDRGSLDVADGEEIQVQAGNYFFGPTVLVGPPGAEVSVRFVSGSEVQHNVTVSELGIDEEIAPGQEVAVPVTLPASGTTVFFCSYHRGRGMLGALVAA